MDPNYIRGQPIREPAWQQAAAAVAEDRRAAKELANPRNSPCKFCSKMFTLNGVRRHENRCAQMQNDIQVRFTLRFPVICDYMTHSLTLDMLNNF